MICDIDAVTSMTKAITARSKACERRIKGEVLPCATWLVELSVVGAASTVLFPGSWRGIALINSHKGKSCGSSNHVKGQQARLGSYDGAFCKVYFVFVLENHFAKEIAPSFFDPFFLRTYQFIQVVVNLPIRHTSSQCTSSGVKSNDFDKMTNETACGIEEQSVHCNNLYSAFKMMRIWFLPIRHMAVVVTFWAQSIVCGHTLWLFIIGFQLEPGPHFFQSV